MEKFVWYYLKRPALSSALSLLTLLTAACDPNSLGIEDGTTSVSSLQFEGAKQAEIGKNGQLIIRWDAPQSLRGLDTSDVRYEVYLKELRDEEADSFEQNSLALQGDTSLSPSEPIIKQLEDAYQPVKIGSPIETVEGIRFYEFSRSQQSGTIYLFQIRSLGIKDRTDDSTAVVIYKAGFSELNDFVGVESISSNSHGSVTITWTQSTDPEVNGYNIYEGTSFTDLVASVPTETSSYNFEELSAGTQVTYGVRAFNQFGVEDENTLTQSIEVLNNKVPNFLGLSTIRRFDNSVKLSWQPADGNPSVYNIYHGTSESTGTADFSKIDIFESFWQVDPLQTNHTFDDLADDTEHHFVVRAAVKGGAEDQNEVVKMIALPDMGPPIFSGIQSVSAVSGAVAINWETAKGQTSSYKIYASTTQPVEPTVANLKATVGGTDTSTTVSSLTEDTTWYLAVRAVDQHNQMDTNDKTIAYTVGDQTPPLFLGFSGVGLANVPGYEDRLNVSFRRSTEPDVNSYKIYTKRDGNTDFELYSTIPQSADNVITLPLTGLEGNTTYSVRIKVVDTSGNESTSLATVSATTLDLTPPTFNGIVSVTRDAESSPLVISSNWMSPLSNDTASFHLFYSKNSMIGQDFDSEDTFPIGTGDAAIYKLDIADANAISANRTILTHLDENSTYYFIVRARDNAGNEDDNFGQVSFAIPTVSPPNFSGVSTATVSAGTRFIDVGWTEPDSTNPAAQYYIYATNNNDSPRVWGSPIVVNAPRDSYLIQEDPNTNAMFPELQEIYIKINARNVEGILDQNVTERVVTVPDISGPVFSGISAVEINGSTETIDLKFSAATDAQSIKEYRIYWRESPAGSYNSSPDLLVSHASACTGGDCVIGVGAAQGLVAGTNYEFKIDVSDVNIPENITVTDSKITQSFPNFSPPAAPTGVSKTPEPVQQTNLRNYTVSGNGTDGKIVRVYCQDIGGSTTLALGVCGGSQALSGTTSFSIPVTLPDATNSYQLFVVQYDSTNGLESGPVNAGGLIDLDRSAPVFVTFTGCPSGFCLNRTSMGGSSSDINSVQISFTSASDGSWQILKGATVVKSGSMFDNTNYRVNLSASELSDESGSHSLKFVMTDTAGNQSADENFTVTIDNSPPNFLTGTFNVVIDREANSYSFNWSSAGLSATDVLTITKRTNSTTAPTSVVESETLVDNLDRNTSTYSDTGSIADTFPVSFTLFACDEFGNCTTAPIVADVEFGYYFNNSNGAFASIRTENGISGATGFTKVAVSTNEADIDSWQGFLATGDIQLKTVGDADCLSIFEQCEFDFSATDPWEKRYIRASIGSSDGKAILLGRSFVFAHVPEQMVYIDKTDWPMEAGLIYEEHEKFSFAIDKHENFVGYGSLNCTDYPCADDGVLRPATTAEPAHDLNFFDAKQGCKNRTAEHVEFTGASEARSIRLPTGVEWVVAAYGTPDQGGTFYCNIDGREGAGGNGVVAAFGDASGNRTTLCASIFGVRNMIGNIDELTDELLTEKMWKRYYGADNTAEVETIPMPAMSKSNTNVVVTNWYRKSAIPIPGYRLGTWSGSGDISKKTWARMDDRPSASRSSTVLRGGGSPGGGAGRFKTVKAAATHRGYGARCAIRAPEPAIVVENFSVGDKARIAWRASGEIESIAILIADHPNPSGTFAGSSVSDSVWVFNTYAGCTDTSYNSTAFESAVAPGSIGDPLPAIGRCGIDLGSLPPWTKRYISVAAYHSVHGYTVSDEFIVARVPDGMVYVDASDWPDTSRHADAAEMGESYSSPFSFAVDKYEVSKNGTVDDCTTETFPCSEAGSGHLESKSATPYHDFNYYTIKTGCDARTAVLAADDIAWVTPDTDRSLTTTQTRRVHLTTGVEWMVSSFGTPKAPGPHYCFMSHEFQGVGTPMPGGESGSLSQLLCKSRYGAMNMIGNANEWTDDLWDDDGVAGAGIIKNYWSSAYTDGVDLGLPAGYGPAADNGKIEAYDFDFAHPISTTHDVSISFVGEDYHHHGGFLLSNIGTRQLAPIRGGFMWHDEDAGRFWNLLHAPNSNEYGAGGRCALRAP